MVGEIIKFEYSEGIDHKLVNIAPGLWQGSRGPAQDDAVLIQYGVTQVLSITTVALEPIRSACRWTLSIDDNRGWNKEQINFIAAFLKFIEENSLNAIVHCDHGASRSSGAIIIWKILHDKVDKQEADRWLRSINPYSNCHPEIFKSLPDRMWV